MAGSPLVEEGARHLLLKSISVYRRRRREHRAAIFRSLFELGPETRILDLGGGNGAHIAHVLDATRCEPRNVTIADIDRIALNKAQRRFGFSVVEIGESSRLPFPDRSFDIVFCNSVIEHISIPKSEVWSVRSGRLFRLRALQRQAEFAAEVDRVGRAYFVQVPYRWFPIESHTWLPFVSYLPRPAMLRLIRLSNSCWIKATRPDFYLPTRREFKSMFGDGAIREERSLGLVKSLIAYRRQPHSTQAGSLG